MKRSDDSGNLSIDFLVGFTIFLIAFIWVVSMIPGLLINLQGYTIDYDAVAYRTGVILTEDPGVPAFPEIPSWENAAPSTVVRLGLSVSKDTPNILSEEKVNQFFCSSVFSYPVDYQNRTIFGDYPYRFNISLIEVGSDQPARYVGDILSGNYGSIRRLVKIKGTSNATIDAGNSTYQTLHPYYYHGDNETRHEFSILINIKELVDGKVTNPIYQINPAREKLMINITDLNNAMNADRASCFNISLNKIFIYVVDEKITPLRHFNDPIINGIQYHDISSDELYDTELPKDIQNISLVFDPTTVTWSDFSQVYFNLTFDLVKTNTACACQECLGSSFLNNTPGVPFDYDYNPDNVTQPDLRDAVLEVSVGSGYRTATEKLIKPLEADFTYFILSGTTVRFRDTSTGSPVSWHWIFEGSNTSSLNNPTHTFPGPGSYTVFLTVTDAGGTTDTTFQPVVLLAPVADFSGTPVLGKANPTLPVIFTDISTGNPTSWIWEYNRTIAGSWTQFSTARNPSFNFPAGFYDIRLTVTNSLGSDNETKLLYISAMPLPVANFTANPTTGVRPLTVTFTDSTTNNPNLWNWSFGDGNYSGIQNPVYIYNTPGTYTVTLIATNIAGSNTMTRTNYINVTSVPVTHTITASAAGGGSVTPSGAVIVSHGGSQTFTITPNAGNHIVSVLVDGLPQALGNYTFTNIILDHTIAATFAVNTPVDIFFDGFESTRPSGNLWTETGSVDWGGYTPRIGNYDVRLRNDESITRTISTAGYTGITVSFSLAASSLDTSFWGVEEYVAASWYDGATWTELTRISDGDANEDNTLHPYSFSLPAGAANNANFRMRFRIDGSNDADYAYVDNVRVTGTHT